MRNSNQVPSVDVQKELADLSYRELRMPLEALFPRLDRAGVAREFKHLLFDDIHRMVFETARALWPTGYERLLATHGFHDPRFSSFSGHCHQCTPALGLVLRALGLEGVSYLEAYRVYEHFPVTGVVERVPAEQEPDPANRDEFCALDRIPYCCLEVIVDGEAYYLSAKHIRPDGERTLALLSPICFRPMVGTFAHPNDSSKSGIYLERVEPSRNPNGEDFARRIVWRKQTARDAKPELFATYLRMELV